MLRERKVGNSVFLYCEEKYFNLKEITGFENYSLADASRYNYATVSYDEAKKQDFGVCTRCTLRSSIMFLGNLRIWIISGRNVNFKKFLLIIEMMVFRSGMTSDLPLPKKKY